MSLLYEDFFSKIKAAGIESTLGGYYRNDGDYGYSVVLENKEWNKQIYLTFPLATDNKYQPHQYKFHPQNHLPVHGECPGYKTCDVNTMIEFNDKEIPAFLEFLCEKSPNFLDLNIEEGLSPLESWNVTKEFLSKFKTFEEN